METVIAELIETAKIILVALFVFGLDVTGGKKKYLLLLYWPVVFLLGLGLDIKDLYSRTLWELLLFLFLFDGKFWRRFGFFWAIFMLIDLIDMFFWIIIVYITGMDAATAFYDDRMNLIGLVFWMCIAVLLRGKKEDIRTFLSQMGNGYYILILAVLFGTINVFSYIQILVVGEVDPPEKMTQFIMLSMGVVILLMILLCLLLLTVRQKNQHMRNRDQIREEMFHYQKKYYEEMMRKYEDMRGFRHEFQHHMRVIRAMLKEDNREELQAYVSRLCGSYEEMKMIHTGNAVADYILNEIVGGMSVQAEIEIVGNFPERMRMEETDFCVLFFNVLENAKEALQKAEGDRRLKIEIKNYQEKLYLTVANSTRQEMDLKLQTDKHDETRHGYGIQNMRKIIEKYHGEMEVRREGTLFIVDIMLSNVIKNDV